MTDIMSKKIYYKSEGGSTQISCKLKDIIDIIKKTDRIIEIDMLTLDDIEFISKKSKLCYTAFSNPLTIVFF